MAEVNDALYQFLLENTTEGILVMCDQGIIFINKIAEQMLTLKRKEDIKLQVSLFLEKIKGIRSKKVNWNEKILTVRIKKGYLNDVQVRTYYIADVTEQHQLDTKMLCLSNMLDYVNDGIIASDSNGRIILFNKQVEKFEGRSREQVLGRHITEVYDVTEDTSEQLTVLKSGKPLIDCNLEYVTDSNRKISLASSTYPVFNGGKMQAVVSVSRNISDIRNMLAKTLELQEKISQDSNTSQLNNGTCYTFLDIIGESKNIQNTIREAKKFSQSSFPIMIYGETGTGKELFAQSIHNAGLYSEQPFVAINCAAIPESLLESVLFGTVKGAFTGAESAIGLFEQARKGTLFLDEINSMPVSLQAKTLRVLQEKMVRRIGASNEVPVYCRIISSTNEDPRRCVSNGTLRKDLYYRLMGINLTIPPLRERQEDIEKLANFFLQKNARVYGKKQIKMSDEFIKVLLKHSWPGNIRELEHTMANSIAMLESEEEMSIHHLPVHLRIKFDQPNYEYKLINNCSDTLAKILKAMEEKVILSALNNHNWNISKASKAIGIGRQNMQYRIRKLNIQKLDTEKNYDVEL